MLYHTSTVTLGVPIENYESLCLQSEKIEIILCLIVGEILSDNERYDLVDSVDIKRQARETDYLSEICYNFNDKVVINHTIQCYADKDPHFRDNYMLLREYYYHDLENILMKLNTELIIDYVFLNPMTVLFNFIVVD
jgi:hypothetical protein